MTKISVIIPTLNEANEIESAIRSALGTRAQINTHERFDIEIIVVDGGSTDKTILIAKDLGVTALASRAGRGEQMDRGAGVSTGDILLFLHADSVLPDRWQNEVLKTMANPLISGGAFTLSIDAKGVRFKIVEYLAGFRASRLGLVYGDQAIFTRKETFDSIGGFEKLPLFEDVDCVMKLKSKGKFLVIDKKIIVSPRRWEKNGIIKNTLRNWFLLSLYMLGFNARGLYRRYYKGSLVR